LVKPGKLKEVLNYLPNYFPWSGADLINVTNMKGKKQMVVIETNSCPSGQKSMPLVSEQMNQGGYRLLIENSFGPYCRIHKMPAGSVLAVLYDKNLMETSGYASVMADYFRKPVYLVPFSMKKRMNICELKRIKSKFSSWKMDTGLCCISVCHAEAMEPDPHSIEN
jgi:hypothetical protein